MPHHALGEKLNLAAGRFDPVVVAVSIVGRGSADESVNELGERDRIAFVRLEPDEDSFGADEDALAQFPFAFVRSGSDSNDGPFEQEEGGDEKE